ncbi:hypothetical protein L6452_23112 [Arctium lappa]|uniref:Uncharacterized protein n=1 Tax=Arctium lappa TaxID=4217 RepID=A0ACB9B297_ARCLA|nr:hypothetical protein L6452_23112 [Arctium lappa]
MMFFSETSIHTFFFTYFISSYLYMIVSVSKEKKTVSKFESQNKWSEHLSLGAFVQLHFEFATSLSSISSFYMYPTT